MKVLLYTALLLLGVLSPLFGQTLSQSYKGLVAVKQNKIELIDNMLVLNMNIDLCGLSVSRYNSLELTFMLRNGNDAILLQPIIVNGANKQKMYERALALKGRQTADAGAYLVLKNDPALLQEVSYKKAMPFQPWMDNAELVLVGKVNNYDNMPIQTFVDVLMESINLK